MLHGLSSPLPANDEPHWQCEAKRQLIRNQQALGPDAKYRRTRCELIAGYWLLRDHAAREPRDCEINGRDA